MNELSNCPTNVSSISPQNSQSPLSSSSDISMSMPCPMFEGCEKKLFMYFSGKGSLRNIPREKIDLICKDSKCTVLNVTSNDHFDAYLLSESSLFVFDKKLMIKTCGTTTLLYGIPKILEYSGENDLHLYDITFSRSELMYPTQQKLIHLSFNNEVSYLEDIFGEGRKVILGPKESVSKNPSKWYVWNKVVSNSNNGLTKESEFTLEIAMFDLNPEKMKGFFGDYLKATNDNNLALNEHCTMISGIKDILDSNTIIDSFVFDPCGYSLNGLLDENYYTIHVTPEDGGSFISFETNIKCNTNPKAYKALVNKVINTFEPKTFTVTFSFSNYANNVSKFNLLKLDKSENSYIFNNGIVYKQFDSTHSVISQNFTRMDNNPITELIRSTIYGVNDNDNSMMDEMQIEFDLESTCTDLSSSNMSILTLDEFPARANSSNMSLSFSLIDAMNIPFPKKPGSTSSGSGSNTGSGSGNSECDLSKFELESGFAFDSYVDKISATPTKSNDSKLFDYPLNINPLIERDFQLL